MHEVLESAEGGAGGEVIVPTQQQLVHFFSKVLTA